MNSCLTRYIVDELNLQDENLEHLKERYKFQLLDNACINTMFDNEQHIRYLKEEASIIGKREALTNVLAHLIEVKDA